VCIGYTHRSIAHDPIITIYSIHYYTGISYDYLCWFATDDQRYLTNVLTSL
jgi:sigma54-dependent transcription regulator